MQIARIFDKDGDLIAEFGLIEQRNRRRDVDENVDRFNAALTEWVRRGEEEKS